MFGTALRQIRAVIAVGEEGSFTRAATRENATQSGFPQHLANVERSLRVKLFERSTVGVTPTPAGLRLEHGAARGIRQQADQPVGVALQTSAEMLLMVISGSTATLLGPIVIVVIMKNVVSAYIGRWNLVLGVIFVAIIGFMPEGLVLGSVRLCRMGWQALRSRGAAPVLRTRGDGSK